MTASLTRLYKRIAPATGRPAGSWDLVIERGRSGKNYWQDLWRFRELFYILCWRDFKVRYKQTAIGAAWSLIRPLVTTLVFTLVFSRIARLQNPGAAPYVLLVFCGMLPWQFFAHAVSEASNSLQGNASLITKIYFPRLIIPVSTILSGLVDFGIALLLLLCMCAGCRFMPGWQVVFLPFFLLLVFCCSVGVGLCLTAVNVKYRDFRYVIPFVVQLGLYVTPVGFSCSLIAEEYRIFYALNPLVGIINGFRWCLLGDPFYGDTIVVSILLTTGFLVMGVRYFRKVESSFADHI